MSSYHAWTHRRKFQGGTDQIPLDYAGHFEIKVFADTQLTVEGDGKFIFAIPADLNGSQLVVAEAYVTTNGSDFTRVQIENVTQTTNLLGTRIRIDAAEATSYTSSVPSVINTGLPVATGDLIGINVDNAGPDSMGLGVILAFD